MKGGIRGNGKGKRGKKGKGEGVEEIIRNGGFKSDLIIEDSKKKFV